MALAAAHARLEGDDDVEIVNYATFLERYGTRGDVELHSVSAWSCAHGVGRWERDCGCRMNPDPRFHQRWRQGLRTALNGLRDGLVPLYEYAAAQLLRDPWAARDGYIDVVVDGSLDSAGIDAFLARYAHTTLTPLERQRALTLLEMQRSALLMFTSCGWFFDDIAGPEAVILLRYARRAIGLARIIDADEARRLEDAFVAELARAESNVRTVDGGVRTGRDVYVEEAEPAVVSAHRVAVSVALTCAVGTPVPQRIAVWRVADHDENAIDDATVSCVVGAVTLVDCRVERSEHTAFGVVGFGGLDWRGVIVDGARKDELWRRFSDADGATQLGRVLDDLAADGGRAFTLKDAPAELRDAVISRALQRRVDTIDAVLAELLLADRGVLRGVTELGGAVPAPVRGLIAHALSRRVKEIVHELLDSDGIPAPLLRRLRTLTADAARYVTLDVDEPVRVLEGAVAALVVRVLGDANDENIVRAHKAARLCDVLLLLGAVRRPLLRLLKAGSALSQAAQHDARLHNAARVLVPKVNAVCASAFAC